MRQKTGSFGGYVFELRQGRFSLRAVARKVGISATYLSKIERDELEHPPSERVLKRMAAVLGTDATELLERAGRLSAENLEFMERHPRLCEAVMRATRGMSEEQLARFAEDLEKLLQDETVRLENDRRAMLERLDRMEQDLEKLRAKT